MAPRILSPAGSRRRRRVALLAPLIAALLVAFAVVPSAKAVHDLGLFELDRNAVDPGGAPLPDDWATLYANDTPPPGGSNIGGSERFTGILPDICSADPCPTGEGTQFHGGGSKDDLDITQWLWNLGEPLDKDDITNAYAAAYVNDTDTGNNNIGDLILYFGLDRFSANGSAQVGFWFLQDPNFGLTNTPESGGLKFSGAHVDNDILVQSNFTNGGVIESLSVYKWQSGALVPVIPAGADCIGPPSAGADDPACGTVNRSPTPAPWPYTPKANEGPPGTFLTGAFFEGGINISRLIPNAGCITNFLAETRTSTPFDARLKDFVTGNFDLCEVSVEKTGDTLGKVGDPADYTITITNSGALTIYKDDITDSLLGDITSSGVDNQANPFVVSNNCGASLAPDASCTITLRRTVQADDPDPLPNTVDIVYRGKSDLSGSAVSDTDSHSVELFQPSVEVVKGGETLSKAGDAVTYDFTINNTSSADSPNLQLDSIDDTLLGDLTDGEAPAACDELAPGASCSFTVTRTVQAADPDPLPNTVTVHYHPAGFTNDISASDDHSVNLFQPAIAVDKTGDTLSKLGDEVDYTFTLSNNSSADTPALDCTATDDVLGEIFSGTLAPGDTVVNRTRAVEAGDPDPLVNTVTLTCTVVGFGNVLEATDSHSVNLFQPAIAVDKTGDTLSKVGDEVTYDFTITNASSADSPNLVLDSIDDTLLGDLTDDEAPAACDTLATPGGSCSFSVTRTVQAGDPDPLPNTVTAHYHPAGFTNDISASDGHEVNLFQPSVAIDKTGDALSKVGDPVDYTITVTNTSSADSPNLSCTIRDPLLGVDKTVNLAPGTSNVTNASRTVQPGDPDPLVNTATADCTVDDFGNVLATVSDSHSVNLFQPSVEVVKTGPASATVGQTITYNFTINNTSSTDSPNLVLDSIGDTILGDLTGAQSPAACDTLATPGGSCTFSVNYTVQQSDPDPLVNVVTVHYHPAEFPNDVSDTDDHSVEIERELAQLAHTQTTCEEFITQTGDAVPPLTEITYGLRNGTIRNVSPGVFFFYASYNVTGSQGSLAVDVAERFNGAVGPLTNDFVVQQGQAFLYRVTNSTCTRLQANVTTNINAGQVVITFNPPGDVPTGTYVLGVKYTPAASLIGQAPCHGVGPQCRYFFVPSRGGVEETARAQSFLFRER
jgi:uncharacterized repeat protein (TIGR01451 family)